MTTPAYRRRFAAPDGYLDFARYGPPSTDVVDTVTATTRRLATGELSVDELSAVELSARQAVAAATGRDRIEAVALSPNTSAGLLHLAFARPAGEVLVSPLEFPANVYPWLRAAEVSGQSVRWLDPGPEGWVTPRCVADALTPAVTAVAVSAVDFRTGYRADLPGLRDAVGDRLLLVDGIQGFGVADMEWALADALVVGGQKWLRAGWSTGFVSLSDRALDRLGGGITGWSGVVDPGRFDGRIHDRSAAATRLTTTNPDLVAVAALEAALGVLAAGDPAAIDAYLGDLTGSLTDAVLDHGGQLLSSPCRTERAGIVSFSLPGVDGDAVRRALADAGVTVTARPGSVRLSPHATTPLEMVDIVDQVLGTLT